MKLRNFKKLLKNSPGFTILELVVVFAVIGVISSVGFAAFSSYSNKQTMDQTALNLRSGINQAKFNAISQVKPESGCGTLDKYEIRICTSNNNCATSTNLYETYAMCSSPPLSPLVASAKRPTNVNVTTDCNGALGYIRFSLQNGIELPSTGCIITITPNFGEDLRLLLVDSGGNISIVSTDNPNPQPTATPPPPPPTATPPAPTATSVPPTSTPIPTPTVAGAPTATPTRIPPTPTPTLGSVLADLRMDKAADFPNPTINQTNRYRLRVRNLGPSGTTGVTVIDDLTTTGSLFQSIIKPVAWSCTTPPVNQTGVVECTNPSFAPGASSLFTINVRMPSSVPSGGFPYNSASVTAAGSSDPNLSNNTDAGDTTVLP